MSMINHDIPPFALVRAELDREIVGEALQTENGLVTIREFGTDDRIRVSRECVEVKRCR